jgi:signal transduction histidine kinase
MIEKIYPIIILIGTILLLVTFYYNRILKNIINILVSLLKLQENRDDNIENYIHSVENKLYSIGVLKIAYDISYLNKKITLHLNNTQGIVLKKDIYYSNISGTLYMEVCNNRGEKKIINKLILYVLALQIVNAIHTDIEKINESFSRIAKLQTYMVHDLKNILQFFQVMQYNVLHLQSQEEKEKFIDFLQNSTQPVNTKVNKILALLQIESKIQKDTEKKRVVLETLIKKYIQQYHLQCHIDDTTTCIYANEESLEIIFENILGNIFYKTAKDNTIVCSISIEDTKNFTTITIQDTGEMFQDPQSVAQPFYTTKEDGLGIGMYQVKTLIQTLGGSIECLNLENKPTIIIRLAKV